MHENAIDLMRREMRVREGKVPKKLDGKPLVYHDSYLINGESFLMRTECGMRIMYRKSEGITVERGLKTTPETERLYLDGSTYAAVASINGLYPIHASAVSLDGRVHAFCGPSGAGKSTLVAELGRYDLMLFCDDTLVLDLRAKGAISCLPGHKRLKLLPDALELTGAIPRTKVAHDVDKFYVDPLGGRENRMLPLAELCFLEDGEPARFEAVSPTERLLMLDDNHYTTDIYHFANKPQQYKRFMQLAQIAKNVKISKFVRPRDRERFHLQGRLVADHVRSYCEG